jgi:hypothetical protein
MTIRIGDAVFMRNGIAAVVQDRNPTSGELKLDSEPRVVQHEMRHGYLNGIDPASRANLYKILDDIKAQSDDPEQRVAQMQHKLNELEKDPHNFVLTKYLRSEMMHIINIFGVKPREYTVNEVNVR